MSRSAPVRGHSRVFEVGLPGGRIVGDGSASRQSCGLRPCPSASALPFGCHSSSSAAALEAAVDALPSAERPEEVAKLAVVY